jgi:hypothetical protein
MRRPLDPDTDVAGLARCLDGLHDDPDAPCPWCSTPSLAELLNLQVVRAGDDDVTDVPDPVTF